MLFPSSQGHVEAARLLGGIYYWAHGVAADYERAKAAYRVGADGGDASCQWQLGEIYLAGRGVDVDDALALTWIRKAALQSEPNALGQLGEAYFVGRGVVPSWRQARAYYRQAIELGCSGVIVRLQLLNISIRQVTWQQSLISR